MDEGTDPDHPSCPRCWRYVAGELTGRLFFRCPICAQRAMHIRNDQKESPRA